jgi:hypothetical protein
MILSISTSPVAGIIGASPHTLPSVFWFFFLLCHSLAHFVNIPATCLAKAQVPQLQLPQKSLIQRTCLVFLVGTQQSTWHIVGTQSMLNKCCLLAMSCFVSKYYKQLFNNVLKNPCIPIILIKCLNKRF